MDVDALLKKMNEEGMNKESLAKAISIDRATIYRKLAKNGEPFTIKEANEISKALNMSSEEATSIFFKT